MHLQQLACTHVCPVFPSDEQNSAQLDVQIPGADWKLQVYNPQIQDTLDTRNGLVALIVVAAFIVSGMVRTMKTWGLKSTHPRSHRCLQGAHHYDNGDGISHVLDRVFIGS
eukprot:1147623-Pelagomonas_calceolata.AAC.2